MKTVSSLRSDYSKNRCLRIFLVEDHHIMRRGLASLLQTEIGAEIVGEAKDGIEALELLANCRPDAVIMDISMPRMNGIEATRRINQRFPGISILILSMYNNPTLVSQALQAGASGYILKEAMLEELTKALQAVLSGQVFISPLVDGLVSDAIITATIGAALPLAPAEELTRREYEILQCFAEGKTVAQIAAKLYVSIYTVYTHRANIQRKLNLHNQAETIRYAVEHTYALNDNSLISTD